MSGSFRFLEDVAIADAAFEAVGDSPSELFAAAARALIETMVNPETVTDGWHRTIVLEEPDLGDLLFEWLSRIVYEKDATGVVIRETTATVTRDDAAGRWRLVGEMRGAPVDPQRHELHADVKAVTKHLYDVSEVDGQWKAKVVIDI
jgi:SHS2 domain-containing protein